MNNKEHWQQHSGKLEHSMQQEISAMREILANMHQEEVCLRKRDDELFHRILVDRTSLVSHLNDLRSERCEVLIELGKHLQIKSTVPSLEEVLVEDDEKNCELLLLQGQIHALSEKMQLQLEENQHLFDHLCFSEIEEPQKERKEKQLGTQTLSPEEE